MAQQVLPAASAPPKGKEVVVTDPKWSEIQAMPEYRALIDSKRRFIIPATIFFIVYYFALPILVGYFPALMSINVVGHINIAYLFALSQFFMAWILMWLYVRRARTFDAQASQILAKLKEGRR